MAELLSDLNNAGYWIRLWASGTANSDARRLLRNQATFVRGRDHNMQACTSWMAGGGVRGGTSYGTTDDFGHGVFENPVSVHDFHATILHLLGLHHQQLFFQRSGLEEQLTGFEVPRVVTDILS